MDLFSEIHFLILAAGNETQLADGRSIVRAEDHRPYHGTLSQLWPLRSSIAHHRDLKSKCQGTFPRSQFQE